MCSNATTSNGNSPHSARKTAPKRVSTGTKLTARYVDPAAGTQHPLPQVRPLANLPVCHYLVVVVYGLVSARTPGWAWRAGTRLARSLAHTRRRAARLASTAVPPALWPGHPPLRSPYSVIRSPYSCLPPPLTMTSVSVRVSRRIRAAPPCQLLSVSRRIPHVAHHCAPVVVAFVQIS